jgi:hypothetical protein
VVLCALFITWFPFTEAAVLSIDAESVGVKRADALLVFRLNQITEKQKKKNTICNPFQKDSR